MLESAGFTPFQMRVHTLVTFFDDVDRAIAEANSVAFGNYLADLGTKDRQRVRDRLAQRLERLRTLQGLRLERYMLYMTARR